MFEAINISELEVGNFNLEFLWQALEASISEDREFCIAGGFARAVAHNILLKKENDLHEYFNPVSVNMPRWTGGDIDVFFRENCLKLTRPLKRDSFVKTKASFAGLSRNRYIAVGDDKAVKIQFITKPEFFYTTEEELLNRFDLVNAQYLVKYCPHSKIMKLKYNPEALELDEKKLVKINNKNSFFLGRRIHKYIKFRGCSNGLEETSAEMLRTWLFSLRSQELTEYPKHKSGVQEALKRIWRLNLIDDGDLALFYGLWTHDVYNSHKVSTIDWASYIISSRHLLIKE